MSTYMMTYLNYKVFTLYCEKGRITDKNRFTNY